MVYAKTPLGGAAQVLQYLSRYTHRTAIGNERILRLQGEEIVISVRAKRNKGKVGGQGEKHTLLSTQDFMARVARVNIQCGQGHGCGADLGRSPTPARPV